MVRGRVGHVAGVRPCGMGWICENITFLQNSVDCQ